MAGRLRELGAPMRLAAFAAGLAVVGGVAALAGASLGNGRVAAKPGHEGGEMAMERMSPEAERRTNGLAASASGYTLVPARTTLPVDRTSPFRFRILDADGRAVRKVDLDGGVRVHLIVVRRDFVGYQHVHPALQPDGSWSVPLRLGASGVYRVFADFEIDGDKTVLGTDLFVVPGSFSPAPVPPARTAAAVDGYRVALAHDPLHAGTAAKLRFTISRGGRLVPAFDPYVGRRGHLVALREGDLSYSHVHPEPDAKAGEIVFHSELPAGRYRLFLQFKVAGVVHTAPFTVEVAR